MTNIGAKGIHGTALAIDNAGLLIVGAAGSGKSALAAHILKITSKEHRICRLISDDRVLVREEAGVIILRPHTEIAGLFALRGRPLIRVDYQDSCILSLVAHLESEDARKNRPSRFPGLSRQQDWVAHLPTAHVTLQRSRTSESASSHWAFSEDARQAAAAYILNKLQNLTPCPFARDNERSPRRRGY